MANPLEPMSLLSLSQAWLAGCLLAALCGGVRAHKQGYSAPLFASVGLLLGLGAVPLIWWVTLEDLRPPGSGVGLNPSEAEKPLRPAARLEHGLRQLRFGLIFGVGGGLLANFTQALTHFLPQIFQETAEEYERGIHPGAVVETKIRILWALAVLVGPGLFYLLFGNLLGLRGAPEDCPSRRSSLNRKILQWPEWLIPAAVVVFFSAIGVFVAAGLEAYFYLANGEV